MPAAYPTVDTQGTRTMTSLFILDSHDMDEARAALAGRPYRRSTKAQGVFAWVLFLCLAVMLIALFRIRPSNAPPSPSMDFRTRFHLYIGLSLLGVGAISFSLLWRG